MRQRQITESLADILYCGSILVPLAYVCNLGPEFIGLAHTPSAFVLLLNLFVSDRTRTRAVASTSLHALTVLSDGFFALLVVCSIIGCCNGNGTRVGFLPISEVCRTGRPQWLKIAFLVAVSFSLLTSLSRATSEPSVIRNLNTPVLYVFLKAILIVWCTTTLISYPQVSILFVVLHGLGLLLLFFEQAFRSVFNVGASISPLLFFWETFVFFFTYQVYRGPLSYIGNTHLDTVSPYKFLAIEVLSWIAVGQAFLRHRRSAKRSGFRFTKETRAMFVVSRLLYLFVLVACIVWQAFSDASVLISHLRFNLVLYVLVFLGLVCFFGPPTFSLSAGTTAFLGVFTALVWCEILSYEEYAFFLEKHNAVVLGSAGVFPIAYGILTLPHYVEF